MLNRERIILSSLDYSFFECRRKMGVFMEKGFSCIANIPDGVLEFPFKSDMYCLLSTDKGYLIVRSTKKERQEFCSSEYYKECYRLNLEVGDRIHLKSMNGIYKIVEVKIDSFVITCNVWRYYDSICREVPKSDFKCFVGGSRILKR